MIDWKSLPTELQLPFRLLEAEKRTIEIELQNAREHLDKLMDQAKQEGKTAEELHKMLYGHDPDRENRQLKARIAVLEQENEWLRAANEALAAGKKPDEVIIETQVPEKKIKGPGRPGIEPWESGQMRKLRKDGWTVREISDRYGRSVGAVQKIVSEVIPDPEAIKRHRDERNKALTESKKTARAARKKEKK